MFNKSNLSSLTDGMMLHVSKIVCNYDYKQNYSHKWII